VQTSNELYMNGSWPPASATITFGPEHTQFIADRVNRDSEVAGVTGLIDQLDTVGRLQLVGGLVDVGESPDRATMIAQSPDLYHMDARDRFRVILGGNAALTAVKAGVLTGSQIVMEGLRRSPSKPVSVDEYLNEQRAAETKLALIRLGLATVALADQLRTFIGQPTVKGNHTNTQSAVHRVRAGHYSATASNPKTMGQVFYMHGETPQRLGVKIGGETELNHPATERLISVAFSAANQISQRGHISRYHMAQKEEAWVLKYSMSSTNATVVDGIAYAASEYPDPAGSTELAAQALWAHNRPARV